ncbi:MAG: c-type cytochrome [Pseudomonadota bacterium]
MSKRNLAVGVVVWGALVSGNALAQSEAPDKDEYYNDRYCMTCHGADGMGSEGINAPRLAGMEEWYLKRQLENFRAGIRGTHEMDLQGREMRPMAMPLTDAGIADLLEWIGGWEYKPTEITLAGDASAGRSLYAACAACHGDAAQGNEALGAPALAGQNDWYLVTQLKNFKAGYRGSHADDKFGAQMVPMAGALADQAAIENVVSYINTLGR